jgi:UDP-N-acetylglucosamine 2-epimerase (non-hydrolysing)
MKKKVLLIFGTRPEAIKLAPIYFALKKQPKLFDVKICLTSQHEELLYQVMDFFGLKANYDLKIMKDNQTLFDITARILRGIEDVLNKANPDIVVVQGDTSTAFIGALSGFYKRIKVVHVEAGLRTYDKYSPFPEEINRSLICPIADFHFAPTSAAVKSLKAEGISDKKIAMVGNSVIDSLLLALKIVKQKKLDSRFAADFKKINFDKKVILVTGHRRENFGKPLENICSALKHLAKTRKDIEIIYPVHLNPNVAGPVNKMLGKTKNIHLIRPLSYPEFIWLMNASYLIITDSGGVQEEGPSLGKPILVTRSVTERPEGVEAGTAKLVGPSKDKIIKESLRLLDNQAYYTGMSKASNPYGDGLSSKRIVDILKSL